MHINNSNFFKMAEETESNDLHGMAPDSNDTALLLIDVINHLDFEGNEG